MLSPCLLRTYCIGDMPQWRLKAMLNALADRGVRVLHDDLGGRCYRRVRWTVGDDEPQVRCVPV